jgi:hypothetical protein
MPQDMMAAEVDDLHECLTAQLAGQNKARDVIRSRSRSYKQAFLQDKRVFRYFWCQLAPVQFFRILHADY